MKHSSTGGSEQGETPCALESADARQSAEQVFGLRTRVTVPVALIGKPLPDVTRGNDATVPNRYQSVTLNRYHPLPKLRT